MDLAFVLIVLAGAYIAGALVVFGWLVEDWTLPMDWAVCGVLAAVWPFTLLFRWAWRSTKGG